MLSKWTYLLFIAEDQNEQTIKKLVEYNNLGMYNFFGTYYSFLFFEYIIFEYINFTSKQKTWCVKYFHILGHMNIPTHHEVFFTLMYSSEWKKQ